MNELIWNGEMDYGWEDLSEYLKQTCDHFSSTLIAVTAQSPNKETKELINDECIERFSQIVLHLSTLIKDGVYYQAEDLENSTQNANKLTAWILLGSLTESILQMFLSFYLDDYKKENWQLWMNFEVDKVKTPIIDYINTLESSGTLEKDQSRSLKEAIKDSIKEHTKEHPVQKIMLEELIQLFTYLKLMDDDDISYLKEIQSNRNGIHSFQRRTIGNWNDLQHCVRFFCYLMEWVLNRFPDIITE